MAEYKRKLGLEKSQSLFALPAIEERYHDIRKKVLEEFIKVNPNTCFDFEKKVYLDELETLLIKVITSFTKKEIQVFERNATMVAYLGLIKDEL